MIVANNSLPFHPSAFTIKLFLLILYMWIYLLHDYLVDIDMFV